MPPDMRDGDGNPVHALYGFARFLVDLIERAKPHYLAVAFDASLSTSFRNRIYPAYKANRDPAPPDLLLQFERCRQFCTHLGVAWFDSPEFEADDIIGTLAARMREQGLRSTLVTRDKDLAQLITPGDVYWDYAGDIRYHHGEIEERFGVPPDRYADYLALTGDAVDNIPGVPGVGPKTATVLMRHFAIARRCCTSGSTRCRPAAARRRDSSARTPRAAPRRRLPRARADAHPLRHAVAGEHASRCSAQSRSSPALDAFCDRRVRRAAAPAGRDATRGLRSAETA